MPGTYFKKGSPETDIAYLAGILDGEGYIGISKHKKASCKRGFTYQVRVQVGTKDSVITQECFNITQLGRCSKTKLGTYLWVTEAKTAYEVLKVVTPYLRLKKNQAELCLKYFENVASNSGGYLSNEEWEYRDSLYQACSKIKKDIYAGNIL